VARNEFNRGFAAANNQGLKLAAGRYALLVNPDVIVQPGAVDALVHYLDEHPEVGIVGPRTLDRNNGVALTAYPAYTPLFILWQYLGLDRLFPNHIHGVYRSACETAREPFLPAWIQGSCLLVRRQIYERIGGLDEALFLYAEEPDFCERALAAGWATAYLPSARVYHFESTTVSRYPLIKMRHYHISPLHYFRKRGRNHSVRVLKTGFTLELLFKLFVRLMLYPITRNSDFRAKIAAYPVVISEVLSY
jgi:GT2 family glycosyltransferase